MVFLPQLGSEVITTVLGDPCNLPVNLRQVAEEMGVRAIRQTRLRDGFTDFQPTGPVIYLGRKTTPARRRFIFAHELAHVMLRRPEIKDLLERYGRVMQLLDEERVANSIAASLLVPDSLVERLRESPCTLGALEETAALAKVSVMMLVTRLATAGIDVALLYWLRGRNAWHVVDRPGAPFYLHGHIELSDSGSRAIESLGDTESDIIVDGWVGDRNVVISGSGRRYKRHAIQLMQPSRDIWLADRTATSLTSTSPSSRPISSAFMRETRSSPDRVGSLS
jgi:Zn-dependent peptidase ImmA (M78 family)